MEYNVLNKYADPKINNNLFSADEDGISHYNKKENYEYIITKKSIENIKIWMHANKQSVNDDKSKYNNTIKYFYYIYLNTDVRCIASINPPYEFVKILLLTYVNPNKKEDSILRHFDDVIDVKIKLIDIIRLNDIKKSGLKLKALKEHYLKSFTSNDIYSYVLNIIRTRYPTKYELNKCYIYLIQDENKQKCIIYPEELKSKDSIKKVVEHVYEYDFSENSKYKLLATEQCYFMIEMIVLLDKYNVKYGNKQILLTDLTYHRNTIEKYLDKYGFDIYENTKKFAQYIKQFITDNTNKKDNKKSSKKPSKKSSKKQSKKILKDKIDEKKDSNKESNKKGMTKIIEKKIKEDNEDNESTITSDSEDDTDDDMSVVKTITKKGSDTNDKQMTFDDIRNKSLTLFLKNNLHKKKGEFTTVKKIIEAYNKSNEYKKLQEAKITVNRTYIVAYLAKYKWYKDNYREKYKDIRSVIMNHTI
jgi:hypothetical protein